METMPAEVFSASACCVPQVEMRDMREKEFTAHLREICRPARPDRSRTWMILIPCRSDISHNAAEFSRQNNAPRARRCCCRQSLTMTRDWQSNTRAVRAGHTWILEAQPKCLSVSPLVGLC